MVSQLEAIDRSIIDVERYGLEHAAAADLETCLEIGRPGVLEALVKHLTASFEPNSTVPKTPLSATAAEKAAKIHPDYVAHLNATREATLSKNMAYTRLISARLRTIMGLSAQINNEPTPIRLLLAQELQTILHEEINFDLIRNKQDENKDQLIGGVPK